MKKHGSKNGPAESSNPRDREGDCERCSKRRCRLFYVEVVCSENTDPNRIKIWLCCVCCKGDLMGEDFSPGF